MEKFAKLKISEALLKVIKEEGFEEPSEIQEKAIPLVLQGKDVIAGSATGSGKTLVFGAGIIQNIAQGPEIKALVLTPTRELTEQVSRALSKFSKYRQLKIFPIYGGVDILPQIQKLRHADVIVGTPGRILDHLNRRTINLSRVKILVLDEADRMLDMGFIEDVKNIIKNCPRERQTLLFSATISQEVASLAGRYMRNPVEVSAESYVEDEKLEQVYYDVEGRMKFSALVYLLKKEKQGLVMVFCNTRRTVDFVAKNLNKVGINAVAIHGGHSQGRRTNALENFHSSKVYILVCTDVAARGLDIKNVSHVYNYDTPKTSEEYIHRVGRTARAGKNGKAITLISERDYENFRIVSRDSSLNISPAKFQEQIPVIYIKPFDRYRTSFKERGRRHSGNRWGRSREYGKDDRAGAGERQRHKANSGFRKRERGRYDGRQGFRKQWR